MASYGEVIRAAQPRANLKVFRAQVRLSCGIPRYLACYKYLQLEKTYHVTHIWVGTLLPGGGKYSVRRTVMRPFALQAQHQQITSHSVRFSIPSLPN